MRPVAPALALLLLAAPLTTALVAVPVLPSPFASLQTVAQGLNRPLAFVDPGDGSGRMFIVEQDGLVKTWRPGTGVDPQAYLDVRSKVSRAGNERGLLGLAFYPDFETSGRLIISYNRNSDGFEVLERLTVANPATGFPPTNGTILVVQSDPFSNHNGGNVVFGPDGYLYWGLGDGGSAGDPQNNAQNLNSRMGKMMRLDVSGPGGYAIPPTNPYAQGGGLPEIWASGLRNPWRFSFDRQTGDLWIGDVGQNLVEEIDVQPAASQGGENYGWRPWEGYNPYNPLEAAQSDIASLTFPVLIYDHAQGCSVTGGYVYRGNAIPELQGDYIFGDYCTGLVWHTQEVAGLTIAPLLMTSGLSISSFGEGPDGELYIVGLNQGRIARLMPPA